MAGFEVTPEAITMTGTVLQQRGSLWICGTKLERAGFQISPDVNHHDGQGTSSITAEFHDNYLELIYPDPRVAISPGLERAAEKFRQRSRWRTNGWCPIGIGLRRTSSSSESLPFETWSWTADWMPKGSAMVMLTPRPDTHSPALFIEPGAVTDLGEQAARASRFHHRNGVHHITAVRLITPPTYQPIEPLKFMQEQGILTIEQGDGWLAELTFDSGGQKKINDLRPDLPLRIHY
jgi:hypothetical protein